MTIILSLTIARPEHLSDRRDNLLLLDELVVQLDGLCHLHSILLYPGNDFTIGIEMERADDAAETPMTDQMEAHDWAMDRLNQDGWIYQCIKSTAVTSFMPDSDDGGSKEAKAQSSLGVRPFSE